MKNLLMIFILSFWTQVCVGQDTMKHVDIYQDSTSVESQFRKEIRELMVLTGSGEMGIQVMKQMFVSFGQIYPDIPSEFWDRFFKNIDADGLVELVIPIYEKHYTRDDIKKLILFYESPIGKKTLSVLPAITKESMIAGQRWGEEIGRKIGSELLKEGYLKK